MHFNFSKISELRDFFHRIQLLNSGWKFSQKTVKFPLNLHFTVNFLWKWPVSEILSQFFVNMDFSIFGWKSFWIQIVDKSLNSEIFFKIQRFFDLIKSLKNAFRIRLLVIGKSWFPHFRTDKFSWLFQYFFPFSSIFFSVISDEFNNYKHLFNKYTSIKVRQKIKLNNG